MDSKYSAGKINDNTEPVNQSARHSLLGGGVLSSDDVSMSELWLIVLKRRYIVLGSVIVCFLLAGLYCMLVKPRYTASATLYIDQNQQDTLDMSDIGITVPGSSDAQTKIETASNILQSDTLALECMENLKLADNPLFLNLKGGKNLQDPEVRTALLGAWHGGLTVKTIPKTSLIGISFRSKSPELSANIVNALMSSYIQWNFRIKYESTMQASDWLTKQISDLKASTQDSEQKLTDYQKKSGIVFWGKDNDNSVVTNSLGDLGKALTAAQADRIVKEAAYRVALTGSPEAISDVTPGSKLQILQTQQVDLKNQYAQAVAKYGPEYPRVKQLKAQLEQSDESIKNEIRATTVRLKEELQASQRAEAAMQGKMDTKVSELYKLNEGAVELQILQREAESNRDLYEGLLKKLKEAGVTAGLKSTDVSVVDKALLSNKPSDPKVVLLLSCSLFAGLFLGLGMAFVADNLDNSIGDVEEAEKLTGLSNLAIIPLVARRKKGEPEEGGTYSRIALVQPKSQAAEAYRSLRTSLMLSHSGKPPKVILITSTCPGEGKSMTSMNLGIVLAQRGSKVLVIDADMRRGRLHKQMDVSSKMGLSNVLAGAVSLKEAIVTSAELPTFSLLPAGATPPNPAELLGSASMRELIQHCQESFDFVVIDAPPVLVVTDPVILASMADATVFVIRYGETTKQGLRRSCNILGRSYANIVGLVVNAVDFNSASQYYYYGSYKYSKYYTDYSDKGSDSESEQ